MATITRSDRAVADGEAHYRGVPCAELVRRRSLSRHLEAATQRPVDVVGVLSEPSMT